MQSEDFFARVKEPKCVHINATGMELQSTSAFRH